ncbi:MAG: primosomal protein N' [Gammaproteobacteria bacterium]|nr:primosomal protein N' [Gammaproteobacteria bacterium]
MNTHSTPHPVTSPVILHIAVPAPLYRGFDYLANPAFALPPLGSRVSISFGRQQVIGVVIAHKTTSDVPRSKLKIIESVCDQHALLADDIFWLAQWAADYYAAPIGEVMNSVLPVLLRQGKAAIASTQTVWRSVGEVSAMTNILARAPKQAAVWRYLQQHPEGQRAEDLDLAFSQWRDAMRELQLKHCVLEEQLAHLNTIENPQRHVEADMPTLNSEQQAAVERILSNDSGVYLLDGVTGSGKTEVYLRVIEQMLAQKKQTLVLVPEIGLTPQLLARFTQRFHANIGVLHSGLNDQQRLNTWLAARDGVLDIIIGTRSAVFTPLANPGLIIVDEEHDASLKQQDGFRYHGRDLAVLRAHKLNIPIVLGSATPSLESLHNVQRDRYHSLHLTERAGNAQTPLITVIDTRAQRSHQALSPALQIAIQTHLQQGRQALLFLNRRGFAPVMMCTACDWKSDCLRCDAHMTLHQQQQRLHCHHCGSERAVPKQCPKCTAEIIPVGTGTERLEQQLAERFADFPIIRIDRDSVRRKGALEAQLNKANQNTAHILVGTQMLAKGHHFPNVTLVGILGIDQSLLSADFRGPEHAAQLITQVAGRAGRAEHAGEVLIETRLPQHPLLITLIQQGYSAFAQAALQERQAASWPPTTHVALLRAEATQAHKANEFLQQALQHLRALPDNALTLWGPAPAPMEKRAGRYRAQLLLQAQQRNHLQRVLKNLPEQLSQLPAAKSVRWSLDVDPVDLF